MTTSTPPAWNFLLERDRCPDCRCAPNMPHNPDCANLDDGEPLIKVTEPPKCPVCRHEMETDEGVLCDCCEESIGVESFAVVNGPGGVFIYHQACYDEVYWGDGDADDVKVMDTEVDQGSISGDNKSFDVPFKVQEYMFESLAEHELGKLHDFIDDHAELIIEMARDRFRKGYVEHGSEMYSWTPKRRLDETLQEIADAVVYPTSGPIE